MGNRNTQGNIDIYSQKKLLKFNTRTDREITKRNILVRLIDILLLEPHAARIISQGKSKSPVRMKRINAHHSEIKCRKMHVGFRSARHIAFEYRCSKGNQ